MPIPVNTIFISLLSALLLSGSLAWAQSINLNVEPLAHIDTTATVIDGAEFEDLPLGAHDPSDEFVLQGLESRFTFNSPYLDGTLIWNFFYDGDEWGEENEEAYLTFPTAPGNAILRGGRMLNRFGVLNNTHLHGREWRDVPLVLTSFLGEEGLTTEGADLTVPLPSSAFASVPVLRDASIGFTLGYGVAREHDDHGHGDEDEDHDDELEDDHREDEHGHDEDEGPVFDDGLLTARLAGAFAPNEFHRLLAGVSLALGEDEDNGDLTVGGIDLTYHWSEFGYDAGRELNWSSEFLLRDSDAGGQQFGAYSRALLRFPNPFGVGLRVGVLEGDHTQDTETSWRISPLLAWYPPTLPNATVRLQGNHIELPQGGDAQTVNLGFSIGLGGLGGFGSGGGGHEGHNH